MIFELATLQKLADLVNIDMSTQEQMNDLIASKNFDVNHLGRLIKQIIQGQVTYHKFTLETNPFSA